MFCVIAGVAVVVIGYVVPVFLFPAFDDDVWAGVIPAVAEDALPIVHRRGGRAVRRRGWS